MEMLNNCLAREIPHNADGIEFFYVQVDFFLSAKVGSVEFEENVFVLEIVIGLLLFEILGSVLDYLGEFIGGKLSQGLVF